MCEYDKIKSICKDCITSCSRNADEDLHNHNIGYMVVFLANNTVYSYTDAGRTFYDSLTV